MRRISVINGIARQSEDALSRAERINQLLTNWRNKLSGQAGTRVALQMPDMIGANPFLTPRGAEEKLDLAYNTVMRAVGQLEKLKVLMDALEPGASITAVADRHGISRNLVYTWLRLMREGRMPGGAA